MRVRDTREKRIRRHSRIRAKINGTPERPRLSVFRSSRHISVQMIDDTVGHTLAAADDRAGEKRRKQKGGSRGAVIGERIAKKALERGITRAVFDRGGYQYHGSVKAIADAARKAGLTL